MARSIIVRRRRQLPPSIQFFELARSVFSIVVLATFAAACLMGGIRVACANDQDTWTLPFPDDIDYGTVSSYDRPEIVLGYPELWAPNSVQAAKGDVHVERDEFTTLTLNGRAADDLSFLLNFPVDAVNGLTVSNRTLNVVDFEIISRFRQLHILSLEKCSLAKAVVVAQLKVASELQSLRFRASNEDDVEQIIRWAARCPKLAYVYCRNRFFNASDIANFNGHPSASFLSVSVGRDAKELFAALKELPNLQALNLRVEKDAPDEYWSDLPALKNLKHFNWSGGLISAELLESMGDMDHLQTLVLQGASVLAEDFPAGLTKLTKLEKLNLRARESLCSDDDIHAALQSLKRLKDWPELKKPSKATLRALASRENRTQIDIDGLGADATIEDVVAALNTDTLTFVHLQGIPITKAIAAAIERNNRLAQLILSALEFDGSLFEHLDQLMELHDVSLHVRNRVTNLDVLSQLPALEGLQLDIFPLLSRDLSFISQCPKLTRMSVKDGFSDDTTAALIGESVTLKHVDLLQDCFMSDAAVESLIKNTHLESLSIGGRITKNAALKLKQLPRLSRLSLWSDLISEDERKLLKDEFTQLAYTDFREFYPSSGKHEIGADGLWRMTTNDGRSALDSVEGKHAHEVFTDETYAQVKQVMQGKVVLIDFWGTWCGPCLMVKPRLQELAHDYEKKGFEVISIHSQRGLDALDEYLTTHPAQWTNLRDEDGNLAESFNVVSYPSLYLFDRKGILRVAQPHRIKLEDAVTSLLKD